VVLSERYHVQTRSDEECDHLLQAYRLDGVHRGYIKPDTSAAATTSRVCCV